MVGEQNLWVIQCKYCAGSYAGNVQPLDAAHSAVFVRRGLLEPFCKFIACPLLHFTGVDEFDLGVRRERLLNQFSLAQSMCLEIQLDGRSRIFICSRPSRRLGLCTAYEAEQKERKQKRSNWW